MKSLILVFVLALCSVSQSQQSEKKKIVCYYTSWSIYRTTPAKLESSDLDPFLCTHIVYAFADVRHDSIVEADLVTDIEKNGYSGVVGLKKINPELKVGAKFSFGTLKHFHQILISIGGWEAGSELFSNLTLSPSKRKTFIESLIPFLEQHKFDGIDIDWEYPAERNGSRPEDRENFVIWLQEIREHFQQHEKTTGNQYLLTVAVAASSFHIDKGYDVKSISE